MIESNIHLLNTDHPDMRGFYRAFRLIPTSINADTALIRSHIAYHSGTRAAERAAIKPSRGHSYRVAPHGKHGKDDLILRVSNWYDHREGVVGWTTRAAR